MPLILATEYTRTRRADLQLRVDSANSFVPTFAAEMSRAKADWQLHAYGHAKHAFTFVGADIPKFGIKYDDKAHRRSTAAIDEFITEKLGQ